MGDAERTLRLLFQQVLFMCYIASLPQHFFCVPVSIYWNCEEKLSDCQALYRL